ncbi:hypothetical protein QN277_024345 [Acacia crassicarpa]|uniref:FAR1 domain-containing protein n=1 Tax=Acacia crassicarpa TaxID=499986 RepID=A0AAE1JGG2_9FABA|nr:hypothetical protein QN277_024345 [Acacia crassicarpa]
MEDEFKPTIGKEFGSLEEAWMFWNDYAKRTGFGARKYSGTKSKKDGETITYRYVCCKEGLRKENKAKSYTSRHRAETRTNCKAKMVVSRVNQKFKITRFDEEHNHPLDSQDTMHLLASQDTIHNQDLIVYKNLTVEDEFKPKIGQEFGSLEEAWMFWNDYARRTGFGARKFNGTKSRKNGETITYRYVCCKEGFRKEDKAEKYSSRHRAETRTNCKAKMIVSRVNQKFKITRFDEEHNHPLLTQDTMDLLASQRNVSQVDAHEIDLASESRLQQKDTLDLMSSLRYGQLLQTMVRLAAKASKTLEGFERVQRCIIELENCIPDGNEGDIAEPFENGRKGSRNKDVQTHEAPPSKRTKVNAKKDAPTQPPHPIEPPQIQYAFPPPASMR